MLYFQLIYHKVTVQPFEKLSKGLRILNPEFEPIFFKEDENAPYYRELLQKLNLDMKYDEDGPKAESAYIPTQPFQDGKSQGPGLIYEAKNYNL